jgi:uncharacterized NAD(P)/FAD-binding protein YdhS
VLESLKTSAPTLLIGTGLTTLDVALELRARGVPGVIAVSRRGLLPRTHKPEVPPPQSVHRPSNIDAERTAVGYASAVRRHIRQLGGDGDWRQVIDSLRAGTPELWRRLDPTERERFMRHLRPFWEVHRHRASPETGAAIDGLVVSGWMKVIAGRLLDARVVDDGALVRVMPRGGGVLRDFRVGAVLNCTGPATDVRLAGDPLLNALFHWGQARPDPLGLGIDVAEDGAIISGNGDPSPVLYYVGPLIRARDGEGTAVPELRAHAARLASTLFATIPTPAVPLRLEPPPWPAAEFDVTL